MIDFPLRYIEMKKLIMFALVGLVTFGLHAQRQVYNMNPGWSYNLGDVSGAEATAFNDENWELVSVPHTLGVVSANLKEFDKYSRNIGWYRKEISVSSEWLNKKVHLEFQGAMQVTDLYVNGKWVGQYAVSGYDSFSFDISDFLQAGKNLIAIKINNKENKNIPPDGITRDFVLFGGIYRDINLVVSGNLRVPFAWEAHAAGVRVTYPEISAEKAVVKVVTAVKNESNAAKVVEIETTIEEKEASEVAEATVTQTIEAGETAMIEQLFVVENPNLWTPETPNLYIVNSEIKDAEMDTTSDFVSTQVGLRWVEWDAQKGFFLNGNSYKLIGTNRHQNWPYIGGAISNGNHYAEAKQLKDLGINWIRLSHYPHDPDFITALDELGLMALEEGPTWMRRGPQTWMDNLVKSWTSMIRRDRNHPSIIIWNACINHEVEAEPTLVQAARIEDPTRALGAEDVYCPMDFNHGKISGNNALTLEHTGHTYPTSRGELRREIEQARRHMEMYKISKSTPGNHGIASWCGYDYNSFYNSKANAARHGIYDLFRLPKLSQWWHWSEFGKEPMVHLVKDWNKAVVYSNCDKIVLYGGTNKNSMKEIASQNKPKDGALANPPYYFRVKPLMNFFKAVGYINGEEVAVSEWSKPGRAVSLEMVSSRSEITADGSDMTRIEVTAYDANGMVARNSKVSVSFAIKEGYGQLIGENPIQLIDGKHIILVQSGYEAKDITVVATARGLKGDEIEIEVDDLEDETIYPENFDAKEPSKLTYKVTNSNSLLIQSTRQDVEPFGYTSVTGAEPGAWVESDVVLVGGITKPVDISIEGGEYRIYVSPWSDKKGKVGGGDAVFVRIKASEVSGEKRVATIKIGDEVGTFEVVTK